MDGKNRRRLTARKHKHSIPQYSDSRDPNIFDRRFNSCHLFCVEIHSSNCRETTDIKSVLTVRVCERRGTSDWHSLQYHQCFDTFHYPREWTSVVSFDRLNESN